MSKCIWQMLVNMPKPEIRIEITNRKCRSDVFTREFTNLDYWKQLVRADCYRTFAFYNSATLRKIIQNEYYSLIT